MKKFLLLLLCLVLSFSIIGCGGNEDDDVGSDTELIKMWVHKSEAEDEGKVYALIAEQFNDSGFMNADGTKKLKLKIEYKNSSDTLSTAINAEVLAGGLPDIITVDAPNITAYADSGILTSINEYLDESVINSYVDSVIEQSTIDGKLYALSGMDAPTGLYYNKDLLASVDITNIGTIDNPWTWDDLVSAMDKLKKANKPYQVKLNLGFGGDEGLMYLYSSLVYSSNGSFVNSQGKTSGCLDSEATVAGIRQLEKMFTIDSDGNSYLYEGTNTDAFAAEECAFQIYGPWDIASIKKNYPNFVSKYDIMPMPVYVDANGNKGKAVAGCGSWGAGVTVNSKHPDSAAKAVAYFTGEEATKLLYEYIGTFPTNKNVLENAVEFQNGPLFSLSEILINCATPRPKMVNYPQLSVSYSKIINYIQTLYGTEEYDLLSFIRTQIQGIDY